MNCCDFSQSRRRLVLAAGGSFCAAVVADSSVAADTPEDRLRELLTDRRSLKLLRGGEQLEATYWTAAGGYNRDEYLSICWLLRDEQADRVFPMNHGLLDVLCGVQTWLARSGVDAPLRIHSGYRSPKTNRRTEGAALNSRHTVGRAVDISVSGVSNVRLAGMASLLGRGGTGLYPGRSFVHVDTGHERIWIDGLRKKA
ncbi:MAG: YcbK family protein [Burkholderiaceae bacterium]